MRLCQCLNYEKLTLEACKDLAKNKRIPPGVAIHALAAQKSKLQIKTVMADRLDDTDAPKRLVMCPAGAEAKRTSLELVDEKDELRLDLQRMQNKVMELEKVCREMKGKMSRMVINTKANHSTCYYSSKGMPRFC